MPEVDGQQIPNWFEYAQTLPEGIPDVAYDAQRNKYFDQFVRPWAYKNSLNPEAVREKFMGQTDRPDKASFPRLELGAASAAKALIDPIAGAVGQKEVQQILASNEQEKIVEAQRQGINPTAYTWLGSMAGQLPYWYAGMELAGLAAATVVPEAGAGIAEIATRMPGVAEAVERFGIPQAIQRMPALAQAVEETPGLVKALEKLHNTRKLFNVAAGAAVQGGYDAAKAEDGHRLIEGAIGGAEGALNVGAIEAIGPLWKALQRSLGVSESAAKALDAVSKGVADETQAAEAAKVVEETPTVVEEVAKVVKAQAEGGRRRGRPKKTPVAEPTAQSVKTEITLPQAAQPIPVEIAPQDLATAAETIGEALSKGGSIESLAGDPTHTNELLRQVDSRAIRDGLYDIKLELNGVQLGEEIVLPHAPVEASAEATAPASQPSAGAPSLEETTLPASPLIEQLKKILLDPTIPEGQKLATKVRLQRISPQIAEEIEALKSKPAEGPKGISPLPEPLGLVEEDSSVQLAKMQELSRKKFEEAGGGQAEGNRLGLEDVSEFDQLEVLKSGKVRNKVNGRIYANADQALRREGLSAPDRFSTNYGDGFWVNGEGDHFAIGDTTHGAFAKTKFGLTEGEAYSRGFVRIRGEGIEYSPGFVTKAALEKAVTIAAESSDEAIFVDTGRRFGVVPKDEIFDFVDSPNKYLRDRPKYAADDEIENPARRQFLKQAGGAAGSMLPKGALPPEEAAKIQSALKAAESGNKVAMGIIKKMLDHRLSENADYGGPGGEVKKIFRMGKEYYAEILSVDPEHKKLTIIRNVLGPELDPVEFLWEAAKSKHPELLEASVKELKAVDPEVLLGQLEEPRSFLHQSENKDAVKAVQDLIGDEIPILQKKVAELQKRREVTHQEWKSEDLKHQAEQQTRQRSGTVTPGMELQRTPEWELGPYGEGQFQRASKMRYAEGEGAPTREGGIVDRPLQTRVTGPAAEAALPPQMAAGTSAPKGQKPTIYYRNPNPTNMFHEGLHSHIGNLGLTGLVDNLVRTHPTGSQMEAAFGRSLKKLYGQTWPEEAYVYAASYVRTGKQAQLQKFIDADTDRATVLKWVADNSNELLSTIAERPESVHKLVAERRLREVVRRATGELNTIARDSVDLVGDSLELREGKYVLTDRAEVAHTFDDRDSLAKYLEDKYEQPLSAPGLVDESLLPPDLPRPAVDSSPHSLGRAPLNTEPPAPGVMGAVKRGEPWANDFWVRPDGKVHSLEEEVDPSDINSRIAGPHQTWGMHNEGKGREQLVQEGWVRGSDAGIEVSEAGLSNKKALEAAVLAVSKKMSKRQVAYVDVMSSDPKGPGSHLAALKLTQEEFLSFPDKPQEFLNNPKFRTKMTYAAEGKFKPPKGPYDLGFSDAHSDAGWVSPEGKGYWFEAFMGHGDKARELGSSESKLLKSGWARVRDEGVQISEAALKNKKLLQTIADEFPDGFIMDVSNEKNQVIKSGQVDSEQLKAFVSNPHKFLTLSNERRFAVEDAEELSGPKGGQIKGGVQAFSNLTRPFYAWLDSVAKKNEWPDLYTKFKALDTAMVERDSFRSKYDQVLVDVFKGVKEARRSDFYRWLEAETADKDKVATELHLSDAEIGKLNKLRLEFYDPLAEQFGIRADLYLQNYAPRVRAANLNPDNVKASGKLTPEAVDFFAKHVRSGELDPRETDLLKVSDTYLRLGARQKFLEGPLKEAAELNNMKTPDGQFVTGSLNPLLKRHIEQIRGIPDYTGQLIDGAANSVKESVNSFLEGYNKKAPKLLQIEPIESTPRDIMGKWILFQYAGGMGGRLMVPFRDFMQTFITTYPILGGKYLSKGAAAAFKEGAYKEALHAGALMWDNPMKALYSQGEAGVTGKAAKAAELSLTPLKWSNNVSRLISYWGHKLRAEDAIANFRQTGNLKQLMRESAMTWLDEGLQKDFVKEIQANADMGGLTKRIAKELVEVSHWNYRQGANPGIYKYTVGRLFGQYGTWPLNYIEYIRRLVSNGDKVEVAKALTRIAVAHGAILAAGQKSGIDTAQWVFTQPMAYGGGPLMQAVVNIPGTADFESYRGKESRKAVIRPVWPGSIPGGMEMERLHHALTTDDPELWKTLLGFVPLKPNEEEKGWHQLVP